MRSLGQTFFIATTALSLAACNLILGNEAHDLDPDAATSAGGAGGSGGAGGDAGQGGAMGSGGAGGQGGAMTGGSAGQGGAAGAGQGGSAGAGGDAGRGGAAGASGDAGQGGTSGRDSGIVDGTAGTTNRDVSIGDAPVDDTSTPGDGSIRDRNDDAADSCTPNSTECRGRSLYLCTATGTWIETLQCPYACVTGACSGSCVPGATQCAPGNTPQTCDDTGKWQNGTACPYVCNNGACTGMCVPGTTVGCGDVTTCNASAIQTCDSTGTLGACTPAPSTCSAVPNGWQPVALAPSGTCPSGFGGAQTLFTSVTATPFTCSCGCSGSQQCTGTATLKHSGGDAGTCPDQPTSTVTLTYRDTCTGGNFGSIVSGHNYQLSNPTYEPSPACGGGPTATTTPPVVTQTTTVCFPNLSCPTGACLTTPEEANLCVSKLGIQTCPAGFPSATVVAQNYNDYRACGQCACASSLTCALNGVILHNDSACGGGPPYVMTATNACATGPSNYPLNAIIADGVSAGSPSCVETTPSMPVGGVELQSATTATVCCK